MNGLVRQQRCNVESGRLKMMWERSVEFGADCAALLYVSSSRRNATYSTRRLFVLLREGLLCSLLTITSWISPVLKFSPPHTCPRSPRFPATKIPPRPHRHAL